MKTLQSSDVAAHKSTKRMISDDTNETTKNETNNETTTKRNTSPAVVSSSTNDKLTTGHLPASIRNIHRLSAIDSQMTNGSR